ncbi:helix-turn-helix domain-containing protein [Methyloligella solikamskensis]|uniref:Helix-turn-helix domain-containing protein n=1 Tax=Methyloligella solikamskensis TaxID=1177756 RepID=A0ABW3J6N5_9HYPH
MSSAFPLVRAADISPFVRWQHDNGRPIDELLQQAGLADAPWEVPDQLVALTGVLACMKTMGRQEGPDIGCRVVSDTSIAELGELGALLLGGGTPRGALKRLCAAISGHSTHEVFSVVAVQGGVIVSEQMTLDLDAATLHIVQQYVATLIRSLCKLTGYPGEPLGRIEITPHPEFGVAHLASKLGQRIVPARSGRLTVFVPDAVLDRPLLMSARGAGLQHPSKDWRPLRAEGRFETTARHFIRAMLDDGAASVERFAKASGLSLRTVQRRLAAEETTFSKLLDDARRERAQELLSAGSARIGAVAGELGYTSHSAFVRAVRRWEGRPPMQLRLRGRIGGG